MVQRKESIIFGQPYLVIQQISLELPLCARQNLNQENSITNLSTCCIFLQKTLSTLLEDSSGDSWEEGV